MGLTGAIALAAALAAGAGDRLLLCRARIAGDVSLARGDAVTEAGRRLSSRFLDYGVACEDASEGARAARRAGLAWAVAASAEGRLDGTRYELVLADAESEVVRTRRAVEVAPGADAVRPLRRALGELVDALPPPPGPRPAHVAAWSLAGAGALAVVAGVVLAARARDAADRTNSAPDPVAYSRARSDWQTARTWSGVSLGAGGAAIAAGLAWRFVF
jgi:hypothetical protein